MGGRRDPSCLVFFEISMIFKIVPKRVYRSRRPQNEWPTLCSRLVKNRICRSRWPQYLAVAAATTVAMAVAMAMAVAVGAARPVALAVAVGRGEERMRGEDGDENPSDAAHILKRNGSANVPS